MFTLVFAIELCLELAILNEKRSAAGDFLNVVYQYKEEVF